MRFCPLLDQLRNTIDSHIAQLVRRQADREVGAVERRVEIDLPVAAARMYSDLTCLSGRAVACNLAKCQPEQARAVDARKPGGSQVERPQAFAAAIGIERLPMAHQCQP